jgi:hypothetical protein
MKMKILYALMQYLNLTSMGILYHSLFASLSLTHSLGIQGSASASSYGYCDSKGWEVIVIEMSRPSTIH